MIGRGVVVRNVVARIRQLVAASGMTPMPARVLVFSDSPDHHREAEATRKKKKQAAAAVTKNEKCGVDDLAQSTFDHVEACHLANSYCYLLFPLRRSLGLL
jgi:hypothetical protein